MRVHTGLRKVIAHAYGAAEKAKLTWGYTENDSSLQRRARSGGKGLSSVQFSRSVVSDSATPWTAACQASLSITNSRSLLKTHVHSVGDAIQPSHPLSSPSPPALNLSQSQGLFK